MQAEEKAKGRAMASDYGGEYLTLTLFGESFQINDGQEVFYEVMEVFQCAVDGHEVYEEVLEVLGYCTNEEELYVLVEYYRMVGQKEFCEVFDALREIDKQNALFRVLDILQCDVDEEKLYNILTNADELNWSQ